MDDDSVGTPILFPETRSFLKKAGIYLLAELVLFLLGISFVLIVNGLVFALLRSAPYWMSPSNFLYRYLPKSIREQGGFPIPLTWWRVPILVIIIAVRLSMVVLGFWLLFNDGFCTQNLICLLLR